MSDPRDIPEDEALAAEYVLRLLDAEAEKAFEARLAAEPEMQALVRFWEAEFTPLAESLPDTPPPPAVKTRLMAATGGDDARSSRGWSLRWLLPSALAAAIVAFLVLAPVLRGPDFDPAFHATLISADGAVRIEAGFAPDNMLFKVIREEGAPSPGRDFELWVIGEGADAPVSLGLVPAGEATYEITPEIAGLIEGGTLAISDEPEGGSPTGAPTGDILAAGDFFSI